MGGEGGKEAGGEVGVLGKEQEGQEVGGEEVLLNIFFFFRADDEI
jgi:hypothetical protein